MPPPPPSRPFAQDGANALVECCKNGSIEGFKAILSAGANIDSPSKKGAMARAWPCACVKSAGCAGGV